MPASRPAPVETVDLDPAHAAVRRAYRERQLHLVEIPRLRLLGFTLVAFGVVMHERFVLPTVGIGGALVAAAFLVGYPVLAWGALRVLHPRLPLRGLAFAFLVLDLVALDIAIYATGADRSWMFFVLCARVADQSHTSVRRALLFAHLVPAAYGLLLVALVVVEGRAVAVPAEAAKLVFLYGTSVYVALTATVTERRRLRTASATLVARDVIRQLEEQSAELRDARRRAEAASEAKSRFLATLSHELRTPLNAIIGFSQVLVSRSHGDLTARQALFLHHVLTSGRRLLSMVDDMLSLVEAETGRLMLERSRFDVAEAVRDLVAAVEPLARDKSLEIVLDAGPERIEIDADRARFRQIVLNLLTNAVKFTLPLGHVMLTVRKLPLPRDGGTCPVVRVSVRDTGVGVRREDQARIFEPFELGDASAAREQGGAGLGLALARRLVALHRGRIWVESEGPGRGSTFSVELPVT
jgi:signal transduction histidine kinase